MLYLKEANREELEQEYAFVTSTPENENGFTNPGAGCDKDEFAHKILPGYINGAKGIGLPVDKLITHEFPLDQINEAHVTNLKMEGLKIAIINK